MDSRLDQLFVRSFAVIEEGPVPDTSRADSLRKRQRILKLVRNRLCPVLVAFATSERVRRRDVVAPACALVAWTVLEGALEDESSAARSESAQLDGGTKRLLVASHLMAWWLPAVSSTVRPSRPSRARNCLGIGLLVTGAWLRVTAIRDLGRSFTGHVFVQPDQAVCETGLYRHMRHPAYAGLLLLNVGPAVACGAWPAAGVIAASTAGAIHRRVAVEENLLVRALGDRYVEYRSRTPAWLPVPRKHVSHSS